MSGRNLVSLTQILDLVGTLDDSDQKDNARERFRKFLFTNVTETGQVRDYIEECMRMKGDQYNKALQDLVNYIGRLLGFEVNFGRYRGVRGEIGYDGHWISPNPFHIVIEVKTTEVYAIKTSTLLGYINDLISEKKICDRNKALGLYIIGKTDNDVKQLENSIIAENRHDQLRTISIDSLLSLAEMMTEYDISHDDILALIKPSGPNIDPVINLMTNMIAQTSSIKSIPEKIEYDVTIEKNNDVVHWLTPVQSNEFRTSEECVDTLVRKNKVYAFGQRTPGRKQIKEDDMICFYATGKGVIAHAQVKSRPENKPHPVVTKPEKYPWTFKVGNEKLYYDNPIVIDSKLRSKLDEFEGRDPEKPWAWFVQATRKLTQHDFELLTKN